MNYRGKSALALALTLGLVTSPASANPYHHQLFAQSGQATPRPAVGANLSLNIPLGGRPKREADNAPVLEFRTGAHLTGTGRDFQVSPLLSYRWKPGVLTEFSAAGQMIAAKYSLADAHKQGRDETKLGISTGGAIGIGLGVVLLAGIIVYAGACKGETDNRPGCSD